MKYGLLALVLIGLKQTFTRKWKPSSSRSKTVAGNLSMITAIFLEAQICRPL